MDSTTAQSLRMAAVADVIALFRSDVMVLRTPVLPVKYGGDEVTFSFEISDHASLPRVIGTQVPKITEIRPELTLLRS